jgi:hypothetical protein
MGRAPLGKWGDRLTNNESNVIWPERFRLDYMDDEEAEQLARDVAEWDAYLSEQPHIQRLLKELRALGPDELHYIKRVIFGPDQLGDR